MSKEADANILILASLMTGFAHTARVVSEMLAIESMTEKERGKLRASLARGVFVTAREINGVMPGRGDELLKVFTGHEGADQGDESK